MMLARNSNVRKREMALYDYRRVTRAQFEAFQSQHAFQSQPACQILSTIPTEQRQKLLEVGRSVCQIQIKNVRSGTGWYLGGEWVVTNTHVTWGNDLNPRVCCATFDFPDLHIDARPRTVLYTHQNALINLPCGDKQVDLALIHVPEIIEENNKRSAQKIPPLFDAAQRPASVGERIFLIHYGSGIDGSPRPQQFSVYENTAVLNVQNGYQNMFTVHTAHSRPGSSGAPLLVYKASMNGQDGKFLVAGVNYYGAAMESILDSPGYAVWFHGRYWIQDTIFATAVNSVKDGIEQVKNLQKRNAKILLPSAIDHLKRKLALLQENLKNNLFCIVVPLCLPAVKGLDTADYPAVKFCPNCTHNGVDTAKVSERMGLIVNSH